MVPAQKNKKKASKQEAMKSQKDYKEDEVVQDNAVSAKKAKHQYQLEVMMGGYYEHIKEKLKIAKAFESSETEEESTVAIQALRPRNRNKFKDLLERESSAKKRKVDKDTPYQLSLMRTEIEIQRKDKQELIQKKVLLNTMSKFQSL